MASFRQLRRLLTGQFKRSSDLIEEGRASFKAGDLRRSEAAFRQALDAGVDELNCRRYLARIYNRSGDWDSALDQWQWVLDHDPGQEEAQLQVARAHFRLRNHERAAQAFRAVLALSPDHPEARDRLAQLGASPDDDDRAVEKQGTSGAVLLDEGRRAFKAEDDAGAEACFQAALRVGADEAECRRHLARIYNRLQDWSEALNQWQWIRGHDSAEVEPRLQIARALLKLTRSAEALSAFRSVLELEPAHAEARQAIRQIEQIRRQDAHQRATDDGQNWLSHAPESMRWQVGAELIVGSVGTLEHAIGQLDSQVAALVALVHAYGQANGEMASHRELYEHQAKARLDALAVQLKEARRTARSLTLRTERMFTAFEKGTNRAAPSKPVSGPLMTRASWRATVSRLAGEVYKARGLEAAVEFVLREVVVDDRRPVFADLGKTVADDSRDDALRLYWLAYGAHPDPATAERLASRMFQAGDLSNAGALVKIAPQTTMSPFVSEMRSSVSLFHDGVEVPARNRFNAARLHKRVAYVASGSLPFQVVGYTVRTHQLLAALRNAGVDCMCFTRPGYPWDRPRALGNIQSVEQQRVIGSVPYVHTPMDSLRPEDLVEGMSHVLERHFRTHGVGIVQAASNSRNALPALIAARRVGAKFIYEVRGLWELTAASRFAGWEQTERYKLDRHLEVSIASQADYVLTITQGVAAELVGDGVPRERLSLLPNAVDPALFPPVSKDRALMARLELDDNSFTVVYAGSLTSYEGLDDVIVALSLLVRRGIDARFVVVGDGEFRGTLQSVAQSSGMTDRVIFVGRVAPDEIQTYLSLADVVAIPRKPFKVCEVVSPLKPFEAMSMAKAVVLSDLPALREIVADGRTGLLCKAADPEDLAATLGRLADDPALRERLGRTAREWVITHRSWSRNADYLVRLYDALASSDDAAAGESAMRLGALASRERAI